MQSYQCLALYYAFSLLTLWAEGQFTVRHCPQEHLRIVSPIPHCEIFRTIGDGIACDPFLYSAAQLAADHLNHNSTLSLLDNITVEINKIDQEVSIDSNFMFI